MFGFVCDKAHTDRPSKSLIRELFLSFSSYLYTFTCLNDLSIPVSICSNQRKTNKSKGKKQEKG